MLTRTPHLAQVTDKNKQLTNQSSSVSTASHSKADSSASLKQEQESFTNKSQSHQDKKRKSDSRGTLRHDRPRFPSSNKYRRLESDASEPLPSRWRSGDRLEARYDNKYSDDRRRAIDSSFDKRFHLEKGRNSSKQVEEKCGYKRSRDEWSDDRRNTKDFTSYERSHHGMRPDTNDRLAARSYQRAPDERSDNRKNATGFPSHHGSYPEKYQSSRRDSRHHYDNFGRRALSNLKQSVSRDRQRTPSQSQHIQISKALTAEIKHKFTQLSSWFYVEEAKAAEIAVDLYNQLIRDRLIINE